MANPLTWKDGKATIYIYYVMGLLPKDWAQKADRSR